MAALGWLMNLDFAANPTEDVLEPAGVKRKTDAFGQRKAEAFDQRKSECEPVDI